MAKLAKLPDEVITRSSELLKDLEKNHIYNGYAINGIANNEDKNSDKTNVSSNDVNSLSNLEIELKRLEESNLKNEFEALKIEKENLNKNYKKLKKDYEKLNHDFEEINNKINEEVAISEDQISFAIVNEDDNILDEIKNLDILSMTPLDAMNALFSLQKKVKNK